MRKLLVWSIAFVLLAGFLLVGSNSALADWSVTVKYYYDTQPFPLGVSARIGYFQDGSWREIARKDYAGPEYTFNFSGDPPSFQLYVKSIYGYSRLDPITLNNGTATVEVPIVKLTVRWYYNSQWGMRGVSGRIGYYDESGTFREFVRQDYASPEWNVLLLSQAPENEPQGPVLYVRSVYGYSRIDKVGNVVKDASIDIPCVKLTVKWYGNGNSNWGMTGVSGRIGYYDEVNEGGAFREFVRQDYASPEWNVLLLSQAPLGENEPPQGPELYVRSVHGASSRIDEVGNLTNDYSKDVPVVRFNVKVVDSNFSLKSKPLTLQAMKGSQVLLQTNGWVNDWYVNLLASSSLSSNPKVIGAGTYWFRAIKDSKTALTTEIYVDPAPGLAGVILMLPDAPR
jgi:hypothetical protein